MHPLNVAYPTSDILDNPVTVARFVQFLNVLPGYPASVVQLDKSTDVNAVHPLNALAPILVQLLKSTDVNDVQFSNAAFKTFVTLDKSIDVSEVHPLNAQACIVEIDEFNITVVKSVHYLNALLFIVVQLDKSAEVIPLDQNEESPTEVTFDRSILVKFDVSLNAALGIVVTYGNYPNSSNEVILVLPLK